VRASLGEIFDVAVDIRRGSPRFGRSVGVVLSAGNFRQLWIPEGFAHGFCVLSEDAEIQYKCTDFYDPASELTIAWDDPDLGIPWPSVGPPLLSAKDRAARPLARFGEHELPRFPG
jgi:dTDP-4-dehydrorhamnose 3,5-epimerase